MARKVFTSFHYVPDNWRANQVRNMGKIEGNSVVSSNKWEEVTNGGNSAIEKWIDDNMYGKSCVVVFVGENTAGRKWIKHEIKKAWEDGKGLVGIHVHNLKDSDGNQAEKGRNPFEDFNVGDKKLSSIVKCYNPPYSTSKYVYEHIEENLEDWIEEAIKIRNNN
ncbi:TIR domain-containing protein [Yeosuana sp.]|uniref:TIR domain-containing protein n=1 Tax=Yeosuana sp. TaxID=2529388 RepID=UPI0040490B7D|tara:strand:+ start:357 stop:848 length:492 start_codon:yes stop_codon:yes gene_type:complete